MSACGNNSSSLSPRERAAVRENGSTSRSLLVHAREADPTAWSRLVGLYAALVATWCRISPTLPRAASRLMVGKSATATLTPSTPTGSCDSWKA